MNLHPGIWGPNKCYGQKGSSAEDNWSSQNFMSAVIGRPGLMIRATWVQYCWTLDTYITECLFFLNLFIFIYFLKCILFFNFTTLYWFCHISKWIRHRYTCVLEFKRVSCCCPVAQSCPTVCDPWIAARQASLSFTIFRSLLKLMSIEWCHPTISFSVAPLGEINIKLLFEDEMKTGETPILVS